VDGFLAVAQVGEAVLLVELRVFRAPLLFLPVFFFARAAAFGAADLEDDLLSCVYVFRKESKYRLNFRNQRAAEVNRNAGFRVVELDWSWLYVGRVRNQDDGPLNEKKRRSNSGC
jgi:hypothetical protein